MAGVTESDVMRFFFESRSRRRARPPSASDERLYQAVVARAIREQEEREAVERVERAAERHAWELAREG